ncbi:MAG: cytidylate kinase-like family protein [Myxococcota bacterium]
MLITLSRQYASGGSEVARLVAEALGWTVVDDDFVREVAQRAGLPPEEVALLEERAPTFLERFARSTALASPELFMPATGGIEEFDEDKLIKITRSLVAELAHEGRVVMVGRAAAAVLEREQDAMHVQLVAPRSVRVQTAIERLGIDPKEAPRMVDERDRNRERYHKEYYERDWADATNYHMVLNTALLGYDGAANLIAAHARALGWADAAD